MTFWTDYADFVDQGVLLWELLEILGIGDNVYDWYESRGMGVAMSGVYVAGLFTWLAPPAFVAGLVTRTRPCREFLILIALILPAFAVFIGGTSLELRVIYYAAYCWLLFPVYCAGYFARMATERIVAREKQAQS